MKKVVVLLVLILLLFGAVLMYGVNRDDSAHTTTESHSWLNGLNWWLGSKHHVEPGDMFISCFADGVFQVTALVRCHGRIRASRYAVRDFRLQLIAGNRVEVELRPRGKTVVTLRFPIQGESKMSPSIQVLEEGADLMLTCVAPPDQALPCRLRIVA